MDAIKLLEKQHHEVEALFAKAEKTKSATMRRRLFEKIGDALAVHATIEEKIFYPNVFGKTTKDILLEAVEEHLAAKRVIADLIALDPTDEHYAAKLSVLKEEITHHIREERKELFPKAKKLVTKEVWRRSVSRWRRWRRRLGPKPRRRGCACPTRHKRPRRSTNPRDQLILR